MSLPRVFLDMDQKLSNLVEELTTSGEPQLSPEKMKELKKICKYVLRFSVSTLAGCAGPDTPGGRPLTTLSVSPARLPPPWPLYGEGKAQDVSPRTLQVPALVGSHLVGQWSQG